MDCATNQPSIGVVKLLEIVLTLGAIKLGHGVEGLARLMASHCLKNLFFF